MKICLDIQAAVAQRAGVGRYVRLLAEHLNALHEPACELSFHYFDFMRRGLSAELANSRAIRWCPGRAAQLLWRAFNWPPYDLLAGRADLYHFPNFTAPPLRRGKCVVSIHDASFLRYPQFTEDRNLKYLLGSIGSTVRRADAIITISRFSASELEEFFPAARGKVIVIYPGVAEHMRPPAAEEINAFRKTRGLERPYLLTVGTIEPRKNLEFLFGTFEKMDSFNGDLVVAGRRGWKCAPIFERARSSPRSNSIRFLEDVSDSELAALYGGASLFMFPSLYEGFGFPPVEAMACGAPVISSTGGSLAEVLGDAAMLIEKHDANRWARDAQFLLHDASARKSLVEKGKLRAARYTWHQAARETMALYRRIAG